MKLSARKIGQIYDLVHEKFVEKRREMDDGILLNNLNKDKIAYHFSQLEIPLAQSIMRLLDKSYDKDHK
jgi:hypothetical protein